MQAAITKKLMRQSFLLSVIFHLLLLLFFMGISIRLTPVEKYKKPPQLYIPSYVYKGAITPSPAPTPTPQTTSQTTTKPIQKTQNKMGSLPLERQSILAMSRNMIQQNQVDTALNRMKSNEPPILLVGDKHAIVDPLIKLMGRSLSAHFRYPKIEGTFGVRGRVYVELVLHPEGYFSDVQIIRSSNNQDFDAAALYAINTAPTVVGADQFLKTPKRFVVGFIFD